MSPKSKGPCGLPPSPKWWRGRGVEWRGARGDRRWMGVEGWGSWRASMTWGACIGTMNRWRGRGARRMQFCDTADYKSALREEGSWGASMIRESCFGTMNLIRTRSTAAQTSHLRNGTPSRCIGISFQSSLPVAAATPATAAVHAATHAGVHSTAHAGVKSATYAAGSHGRSSAKSWSAADARWEPASNRCE